MAETYFSLVTNLGTQKMLEALNEEKKVNITEFAVGDGGGQFYKPTAEQETLKNELWRGSVTACYINEASENLLVVETIIPADIGGFTVREMGLFDADGVLIAVCNTPDAQKVKVSDGVVHELALSMELALTSTDSVELVIDPNVVVATKKDLERIEQTTETAKLAAEQAVSDAKEAAAQAQKAAERTIVFTPELTEGTKIATFSIGEEEKVLYAPTASGGSVIRGTVAEETFYLQKVYAKKGDAILAETTINAAGQFVLSGIIEIGEIKLTTTNGTETAETTLEILAYSLYEVTLASYTLYGFHISANETDPSAKIKYIAGCDNENFTPAKMDFATGEFNSGSWVGKHQWFFPKPCMLRYDGTVAYYLQPNDYTKKEDGDASDIANESFAGNAMMEWGQNGKKIWIKVVPNPTNIYEGDVYISDQKVDENFHAWSFYNNQDILCDHFYTPIYNGTELSGKIRSLSEQVPVHNKTAEEEITLATANNTSGKNLWYTETYSDRFTINMLLLMMACTTDTQTAYGNGNIYYASNAASSLLKSGTMNDKGLFWGSDATTTHLGVKVFGMENWWGNQWRRIAGYINDNGTQKVKMTYGKADGSALTAYNTTGNGYHTIASSTPDGTSGGYLDKMILDKVGGMIPKTASGSATTHYTDCLYFKNSQANYALVGGFCNNGLSCGALASNVSFLHTDTAWYIGTSLSCKPLANIE